MVSDVLAPSPPTLRFGVGPAGLDGAPLVADRRVSPGDLKRLLVIVFVLGLTSCGGDSGRPGRGEKSPSPLYSCGGSLGFPKPALRSPLGAESGSDPASRALHGFLYDPVNLPAPGDFRLKNWRVLVRRPTVVSFGHERRPGVIDQAVTFRKLKSGSWRFEYGGDCTPTVELDNLEAIRLRLARRPSQGSRVLHLLANTGSCDPKHPARDPRERFVEVRTKVRNRSVGLLAVFRQSAGNCAGVGLEYPLTVRLPHRLGKRRLYDVSTLPAMPVRLAPPE
jgi:hypothetical protein